MFRALSTLLAVFAFAGLAHAQIPSIVATSGNGATVSLGGVAAPISFVVKDAGGNPRSGVLVHFEPDCVDLMHNELPPYACASALSGDPLDVVTDSSGRVQSPRFQANATVGIAWFNLVTELDGYLLRLPFFLRIGSASLSPIQLVAGDNQVVQVGTLMAQQMILRVVDDRGRPVGGVPVSLNVACGTTSAPLPCVQLASTQFTTDPLGLVRSGFGRANTTAGAYTIPVRIAGDSQSASFHLTNVLPTRSAIMSVPGTAFKIALKIADAPVACSLALLEPVLNVENRPRMLALPFGLSRVVIENCPAGSVVTLTLQHPDGLPEGERIWVAKPAWKPLPTTTFVAGTTQFVLTDGGDGDADGLRDGSIEGVFALAFGNPDAPSFQDLWWVGTAENGWGLSIVQHGEMLFPIFFAYDASGRATWYAMPGGSWNAAKDTFTGPLYLPRGAPLAGYSASSLVVGAPVGSASIFFRDVLRADLVITIGNVATRKEIVRQLFGPMDAAGPRGYGDMWWAGPSQNGWGLVLQQQYSTLFGVLFTYRADGSPTWFTLPSGDWTSADTYEGHAYRTTSSPWPLAYDPARLVTENTGFMRLRFSNGRATFDYLLEGKTGRVELVPLPF